MTALVDNFEAWIVDHLEVSILGDTSFFLGIRVIRDQTANPPFLILNQEIYTKSILEKHNFDLNKKSKYPMSKDAIAYIERKEDEPKASAAAIQKYQSCNGSLMYLMLGTRPDIAYTIGCFARFAHDPSRNHFLALTHIFWYINATTQFIIKYVKTPPNSDGTINYDPVGYCDADFAGELATTEKHKSTSGYVFDLAGGPFSWSSKLQKTVATSPMEAEYIAMFTAATQAAWIQQVYVAIGHPITDPTKLYRNNTAATAVVNGQGTPTGKKHIEVKYHYTQGLVAQKELTVNHINTEESNTNTPTKCLTGRNFGLGLENLALHIMDDFINLLSYNPSPTSDTPNPSSVLDVSQMDTSVYIDADE